MLFNRIILPALFVVMIPAVARAQEKQRLTLYFDFNSYALTPRSRSQLDSLLSISSAVQKLGITGHCDKIGTHIYNDGLALRRAEAVSAYLKDKGLKTADPVIIKGEGKRQPLNDNKNDAERELNRRVELTIEEARTAVEQRSLPEKISPPPPSEKQTLTQKLVNDSVDHLVLPNMNFEGSRHKLIPEAIPVLEELVEALKNNPTLKIEIQGHVCCTDMADGYDLDLRTQDLSVQRARAIYQFLVAQGIAANRLSYAGFGGSQKLFPYERNAYEEEQNRRVEIKIIAR